jgi:Family of unknown function (DUF5372)
LRPSSRMRSPTTSRCARGSMGAPCTRRRGRAPCIRRAGRLCCVYVLRPAVAQERVEQRPDGLVRITLKKAYADGTIAVDMDPLSLRCRLATSVPRRASTPSTTRVCSRRRAHGDRASRRKRSPKPEPPRALSPLGRISPADTAPGRSFWRAASTTGLTAARTGEVTGPVRVIHSFHPLYGQELDVVAHRVQWGEERVFYRDPQGHRASMPVGWTSLAPPDPYLAVAKARSRFRLEDLIDLANLLAGVRR